MKTGRKEPYTILRVCERFPTIIPPGVQPKWEDNTPLMQNYLLTYEGIREEEEYETLEATLNAQVQHKV